jgi:hypothetical protein
MLSNIQKAKSAHRDTPKGKYSISQKPRSGILLTVLTV